MCSSTAKPWKYVHSKLGFLLEVKVLINKSTSLYANAAIAVIDQLVNKKLLFVRYISLLPGC
jgi:hypothetical protein